MSLIKAKIKAILVGRVGKYIAQSIMTYLAVSDDRFKYRTLSSNQHYCANKQREENKMRTFYLFDTVTGRD